MVTGDVPGILGVFSHNCGISMGWLFNCQSGIDMGVIICDGSYFISWYQNSMLGVLKFLFIKSILVYM